MSKSTKNVLQQSNCNLDVPKEEDHKLLFVMRAKEEMSFETENQCSPQKKPAKSEAKKLRSIRLDLSSLKRGVIQKASLKVTDASSDESSEDEGRKKRKARPVVPNYVTNTESGPCRKPRQSRQDPLVLSSQSHLAKAQPLSIARRNARERNRVKQVNEGFATLRSRIPEYISEAYNEEKGRRSAKKLSKVETLRMAVDYIRHLETLLDLRTSDADGWMKHIKSESQPWDTPTSSGEYPSPKYQPPCVDSPGTSYDQTFEYQDRIFYDYDLDLVPRKEAASADKSPAAFSVLGLPGNEAGENQCVDDFKYYETFNRIKKKNGGEAANEDGVPEEDEEEDLENLDVSQRDAELLPKPRDAMRKLAKGPTVLPPITESFGKGIPVFF